MIKDNEVELRRSLFSEGVLFVVIGVIFTLLNFVIYLFGIAFFDLSPPLAAGIAFLLLIPLHFMGHSRIVFLDKNNSYQQIAKYTVALAVSFLLNVLIVWVYWAWFMSEPLAAQILGSVPASFANYLLLKYLVFSKSGDTKRSKQPKLLASISVATTFLALAALYLAVSAILLYTNNQLFADDWRHYRDYFFDRTYIESIFGRQNGHLMIVPNLFFYHNYTFLSGKMIYLAIANVALLGSAALVVAKVMDDAFNYIGSTAGKRVAIASISLALMLCLLAPVTQFWGIGLHNHIVVLSVICAAYFVSGNFRALDSGVSMIGFSLFSILAATSFSFGAASSALGFLSSVANRQTKTNMLIYFFLGLVIAISTLGLFGNARSLPEADFEIFNLLKFLMVFLANPMCGVSSIYFEELEVLNIAFIYGLIGLVSYLFLTHKVFWLTSKKNLVNTPIKSAYQFFWLIASFVIVGGALVYMGRGNTISLLLLSKCGRFATWGALFWVSMVCASVCLIGEYKNKFKTDYLLMAVLLMIGALTLIFNFAVMDKKIRYVQKYHTNQVLEIAINSDVRPTRAKLWREEKQLWVKLIGHLKNHHRNIFSDSRIRDVMSTLQPSDLEIGEVCSSRLRVEMTERRDEFMIRGRVTPSDDQQSPLEYLYFVNSGGVIEGLALPVFGARVNKRKGNLRNENIIYRLKIPLLSSLPGVSGEMYGLIRRLENSEEFDLKEYKVIGKDRYGNSCIVKLN